MAEGPLRQVLWTEGFTPGYRWPGVSRSASVDVVIIGAGLTGLSTALHLAERGLQATLIEAGTVGSAASGRNGGQVVPGLKPGPELLTRRYGRAHTEKMHRFSFNAADYAFELIERFNIDCSPTRNGWIQAAVTPAIAALLQKRAVQLKMAGADVEYLSRPAMRQATGSDFYSGGLNEKSAGAVQPLKLAMGLARAASDRGVSIFENSEAVSIAQADNGWDIQVNGECLHARQVVLATDAYTAKLFPRLARSFLSVGSAQIATEPLHPALLKTVLPREAGISEARKIPFYCRIDPAGRFLIGGRGPRADVIDSASVKRLQRAAVLRFPALADVRWEYGWAGQVGLTLDDAPRLSNPEKGLWTAYGYSGRGVALAIRMGSTLAHAVSGSNTELDYPLTELRPLFWHWLRQPAVATALAWYRTRDALGFPI